jgi:RNA polymerase sigma-B factor
MDPNAAASHHDGADPAALAALRHVRCDEERALLEDEVIRRFRPLARSLATRYAHRGAETEDLVAVADFALLKALRRFDSERGSFAPFATATILGEIKKYFRDCCWTVRPTRRIQEFQGQVTSAADELRRDGGPGGVAEIAASLDVPIADVHEALSASKNFSAKSLDAPADHEGHALGSTLPTYEDGYELVEERVSARALCADLAPEDRELLRLRYFEDRTQQEIASLLETNQVQVSRRLKGVLAALRAGVATPSY